MASQQQIEANQKNAQLTTGPASEAGRERSSRNSTKHGYTGRLLIVPDDENEAYEAHVDSYYKSYAPSGPKQIQLLQQLADLHWAIHQIFTEQANAMSLLNSVHTHARQNQEDPASTFYTLNKGTRHVNTLSLYESRKRSAAK